MNNVSSYDEIVQLVDSFCEEMKAFEVEVVQLVDSFCEEMKAFEVEVVQLVDSFCEEFGRLFE